jgi:MATE family multidrug resistance protein
MCFAFFEMASLFIERIFLSHHSSAGVASALNATYLFSIFQLSCAAVAAIAQVFVGLYQGSGELRRIGPCIWQLIWFSLVSQPIILPISLLTSSLYFGPTAIAQTGVDYFGVLAYGNFLFPLCAALSSFYLGRGKVLYVTALMLSSYVVHVGLSWCLIFGIEGLLPSFGIRGGALARCLSVGLVCMVLLISFLSKTNRALFNTGECRLVYKDLWFYLKHGLVRAFAFFWSRVWWAATSFLMLRQGGTYANVLTIGGTVISFLQFPATGLQKAVITIASNLFGAKNEAEVWRLCRSLFTYVVIVGSPLAILIIQFPQALASFFDSSTQQVFHETFPTINFWVWGYLIALTIQVSLCALIVSARDLKFQFYSYLLMGVLGFIPAYLNICQGWWQPDKLWAIMALDNILFAVIFFMRIRKQRKPNLELKRNTAKL